MDRDRETDRRAYFWLMGTCLLLILLSWFVIRLWSPATAVVLSVIAMVIPPVAAIVGNRGALRDSEPPTFHHPPDPDR